MPAFRDGTPVRKVRRKRTPARGPQGLPAPSSNAQTNRAPAPAPNPKPIVQAVAESPAIRRTRTKPHVGPQGLPGPASSNTSTKAREDSAGYRKYIAAQVLAARQRAGVTDAPVAKGETFPRQTPTSALEAELDLLRNVGPKHSPAFQKPRWYDLRDDTRVDLNEIAKANNDSGTGLEASLEAPVAKVLEQTVRPLHAIAGATDAAIKGENVIKAAGRGFANKDKTTFSRVLKDLGAPGIVQSVGGFGLDVALDPTTYLTGGVGSVARKEATKAAKKTTTKASALGLSEDQATRMGSRAADKILKEAAAKGDDASGLSIRIGGLEIPGIRKATAKAVPRKVRRKVKDSRARQAARDVAADVNPNIAPAGLTKAEADEATRAVRTARAKAHRGTYAAQQRAIAIKKHIGADNYQKVIDALEANDLAKLAPELRAAAIEVRSLFRNADRVRRQAGIKTGGQIGRRKLVDVPAVTARPAKETRRDVERAERAVVAAEKAGDREALDLAVKQLENAQVVHATEKALRKEQAKAVRAAEKSNARRDIEARGYVPHVLAEEPVKEGRRVFRRPSGKAVTATSSKVRKDPRPLAAIREDHPGVFSEDLPQLVAGRMSEAAETAAKADLNRRLADSGRPVPRDNSELALKGDEAVFHVTGASIREVTDATELGRLTQAITVKNKKDGPKLKGSYQARKGGKFVILNRKVVDRALEGVNPVPSSVHGIGRGFDRLQGGFKAIATVPNPGFHVRNVIGDTANAYLAESPRKLARNIGQAARALKHLGAHEEALRDLSKRVDPSDAGLKIGGKKVLYSDLVKEAEAVGAIRSGFIARELPELAQKNVTRGRDRLHRFTRQIQNREDVVRLATYIGSRKRGLSPEKAAERSAKYHFDYSHLTSFERNVARRAMPFYTWSARSIPLQARSLVTKPGKFANFEKLREEAAQAGGFNDEQAQEVRDLYTKLEQAGVDLPEGWQRYLSEWEQRAAGIPVNIGGGQWTISFALPVTDVGMVPGAAGFDEWVQRALSLATPIVLTPIELQQNYSTFFRDKIESDTSPLVTAPSYVGKFPDSWKQKLGVTRGTDNRTGKTVWRWPGRLDFVAHAVPGPTSYAQRFATESSRGQTLGNELLGYAGIKATKFDPVTTVVGIAYDRMSEIQKEQASLRQQLHNGKPINADNPTPEYERLADQLGLVEEVAYGAKDIRGDAVLPTAGAPRKIVRKKKPNGWDSAGSSSNEWGESSSSSGWSRPSASSSGW